MPGNEWPDDNDRINYPVPGTSDQKDDFHGTVIADPYRPLEDSTSAATQAWVAAQDRLPQRLLASLPARPAIEARLAEIWSQPSPGIPFERGGRWFQRRRPAGAEQDVLYAGESADGCDQVPLDPAGFSADGSATLVNVSVSPDGSAVAYSVSESGSDWQTWHVRDAATAADLDDRVRWSKLDNAVWHPDGSGFYTRLVAPQPVQVRRSAASSPDRTLAGPHPRLLRHRARHASDQQGGG